MFDPDVRAAATTATEPAAAAEATAAATAEPSTTTAEPAAAAAILAAATWRKTTVARSCAARSSTLTLCAGSFTGAWPIESCFLGAAQRRAPSILPDRFPAFADSLAAPFAAPLRVAFPPSTERLPRKRATSGRTACGQGCATCFGPAAELFSIGRELSLSLSPELIVQALVGVWHATPVLNIMFPFAI